MSNPSDTTVINKQRVVVWDAGVRIFHWALLAAMIGAFVTIKMGKLQYHTWCGYVILALLLFRLVWGFVGGTHARFTSFIKGPGAIIAYLKNTIAGGKETSLGHNPLGALSVLAMLAALLFQSISGFLTNSDDFFFEAPLYKLVGKELSDKITTLHKLNENVMLALIGLHLAAIAFYFFFKKENLVKPMLTGVKEVEGEAAPSRGGSPGLAVFLMILAGIAVFFLTRYGK